MLGLLPWNFTKSFFLRQTPCYKELDKPFVQSEVQHFNYWHYTNELSLSLMHKLF